MPSKKAKNKRKKEVKRDNKMPGLVKGIAVLEYIWAVFFGIIGLLLTLGAKQIYEVLQRQPIPGLDLINSTIITIIGLLVIIYAILIAIVARGLWRSKQWARIITIIFAGLAAINTLFNIFHGRYLSIIRFIIYGFVAGYLIADKDVKKAFAKR